MHHETQQNWHAANQQYLMAALSRVRDALERHTAREQGTPAKATNCSAAAPALEGSHMPTPPALEMLCDKFGLSPFERDVLLLCAATDLNGEFAKLCADAQGDPQRTYPTFSLALACLPDPHWSALTPAGPLRYWRLIEVGAGNTLTLNPLRIDERVLHYLAGVQHLDDRLVGLMEPVRVRQELVPSHQKLAGRIAATWTVAKGAASLSVIQLCGRDNVDKRAIAAAACASLGLALYCIGENAVPSSPTELDALLRLWEREATLSQSALLLELDDAANRDAARASAINRIMESARTALIVTTRERRPLQHRPTLAFDVANPSTDEQRSIWHSALGSDAPQLNGQVEALVSNFSLNGPTIQAACAETFGKASGANQDEPIDLNEFASTLWDTCRTQARPRLDNLARRIEPAATWEDLVLPDRARSSLDEIAVHVRQRMKVYETWGFGAKSARGLGISALFAGPSGTGKTMAAEVLADELRLDLYHIDLSAVVSKYIGETEKNLRRIFDAAEECGAILLFDEADALFGKRSEVKDSHDRYANIETSYLLQRMEAYRGLAVLTTNMKQALDTAFLRRIRFVVQFPFPDATQRAAIWRRIFPADTPTDGLDVEKLTRLSVTGGNIRNIAMNAAFLAADDGQSVGMSHLLRAARTEYAKLEKPLSGAEIGGWV